MSAESKVILIVEDDPDNRTAITIMVEGYGYRALVCSSGAEALEALKSSKVHLALIDIMMPLMNGYELLSEIKKMPNYVDLPVIMVTAKDQDAEIIDGYRHGADYYIPKPFTAKQLEYGVRLFLP